MQSLTRSALIVLLLTGCVGCDQVSKMVAREYLAGTGIHSYLADTFRLQYAQNPGAFLSFGADLPADVRDAALIMGVGAMVTGLFAWALFSSNLSWLQRLAVAAIGASGASNLIDRIRFNGAVTDFLNLGIGSVRTGIFNVADVTLMVALAALLLSWRSRPPNG